jgi:predicted O-methyltransferase YrrM
MQSRSYWSFMRRAQGRHNLHSPFVFGLTDVGLSAAIPEEFRRERKKWLREAGRDTERFAVLDLGAGSGTMKKMRSVARLSKNSSSRGIYGDLLFRLSAYLKPGTILELGTSIGTGTVHLKAGNPGSTVITVEGCPETLRRAYRTFDRWKLDRTIALNASFAEFLERPSAIRYDMVFLDGHHDGQATLDYIRRLEPLTHDETAFILDDIRWSDGMWKAWNELVADERFHVTIDFGRMGVIWKRPQQVKEHFVIRPRIFRFRLV